MNRDHLITVLLTIRFLAHQGLPLRGSNDGKDSNVYQLMLLRSENSAEILDRARFKHTSTAHQIYKMKFCLLWL